MNTISMVCTAALGLLLFVLGMNVSRTRFVVRRLSGCPDQASDPLNRAIRAHGNTAEYAPFFAILFIVWGMREPPQWIELAMIGATVARYLLAAGILFMPTMARPNPLRFLGAFGTYLFGTLLSLSLLTHL